MKPLCDGLSTCLIAYWNKYQRVVKCVTSDDIGTKAGGVTSVGKGRVCDGTEVFFVFLDYSFLSCRFSVFLDYCFLLDLCLSIHPR